MLESDPQTAGPTVNAKTVMAITSLIAAPS
jgi:hypothetical protein